MTTDSGWTSDQVKAHYADDANHRIRQRIHEQYTQPQIDFPNWVLKHLHWRGDERVLDVGAGTGAYLAPLRARIPRGQHIAGDLSAGMMARYRGDSAGSLLVNLDAQTLPFPDNYFDVVLANHMLYHVPDIDAALGEIKRVLRPDGLLVTATNSAKNMPELRTLYRRAVLLLTNFKSKVDMSGSVVERFSLEDAPCLLARHFFAVSRHDLPSALVFLEAAPVLEYVASMRDLREPQLPEGVLWSDFMDIIRQQTTKLINHTGRLVVNKLSGVVIATDHGGFVQEYAAMLDHDKRR